MNFFFFFFFNFVFSTKKFHLSFVNFKKKLMGTKQSICNHQNLKMDFVQGPKKLDYKTITSYKPTFAHFTCSDCKLDCFRRRDYYYSLIFGDIANEWEHWEPQNESEKRLERCLG